MPMPPPMQIHMARIVIYVRLFDRTALISFVCALHPDAAYKNKSEQNYFTHSFADLCKNYGITPTRNNRDVAHENGAIESPNNHIKRQLHQALVIRASAEFPSLSTYNVLSSDAACQQDKANLVY